MNVCIGTEQASAEIFEQQGLGYDFYELDVDEKIFQNGRISRINGQIIIYPFCDRLTFA